MKIHRFDSGIITQRIHEIGGRLDPQILTVRTGIVALGIVSFMLATLFLSILPILKGRACRIEREQIQKDYDEVLKNGIDSAKILGRIEMFMKRFADTPQNENVEAVAAMKEDLRRVSEGKQLGEDNKSIGQDYDAIFKDLQAFQKAGNSHPIWEKIRRFKAVYKNYEVDHHFKIVNEIETNLKFLQGIPVKIMPLPSPYRVDERGVIIQPDDGNCLFHACITGLVLLKKRDVPSHEQLREEAVNWMRTHIDSDEELQADVTRAISDLYEAEKDKITTNITSYELLGELATDQLKEEREKLEKLELPTRNQYFDEVAKLNAKASGAEMRAVSELYGVAIRIVVDLNGQLKEGLYPNFNEDKYGKNGWITLVYTGGDHFNVWPGNHFNDKEEQ